jgi:hypothetical protein
LFLAGEGAIAESGWVAVASSLPSSLRAIISCCCAL